MDHLGIELTLAHQAMRREEAAAARLVGAARSARGGRRLPAALSRVRRGRRTSVA